MPKKKKSKLPGYGPENVAGDVIRNQFVSGDGSNPAESLKHLQEMFRGKVDGDVVQLVFSECGFNVEQALESLFTLTAENELKQEVPGASCGPPLYSEIRPKVTNNPYGFFGKHISMDSANNLPSQSTKFSCSGQHKVDKRLCDFAASRSSWIGISNSSDSSTNDSDLSDPVAIRNSRELRHRYVADVVCHKPDSADLLKDNNRNSNSVNTYENVPVPGFQNMLTPSTPAAPDYEAIFPQTSNKNARNEISAMSNTKLPINSFVEVITLINQRKKVMVVLRGLPGSGKTTLAKNLVHNGLILSTDDYFSQGGEYFFDPNRLSDAHNWNRDRAIVAINDGVTPIIIDNTNTESWEMLPYISLAIKSNYIPKILEPETPWKFKVSELARRNQHNVPKPKIQRMLDRYEKGLTVDDVINRRHPKANIVFPSPNNETPAPTNGFLASSSPVRLTKLEFPLKIVTKSESPEVSSSSSRSVSSTSLNPLNSDTTQPACSRERLDLKDLMALVQQDSEDSQSASRRTSSSSQDASGWECDEEFTWTNEEAQEISEKYSRYLTNQDIPEEADVDSAINDVQNVFSQVENIPPSEVEIGNEKIKEWFAKEWVSDKLKEDSVQVETEINQDHKPIPMVVESVFSIRNIHSPIKTKEKNDSSEWDVLEVGDWSSSSDVIEETDEPKPQRPPKHSTEHSSLENNTKEWSLLGSEIWKVETFNVETQTIPEDYAALQRVTTYGLDFIDSSFKVVVANPINSISTKAANSSSSSVYKNPRQTLVFDKSTITDNIEEIDKEAKIKLLSSMFPSVTKTDLEYVLEKCFGDHNWAMNSLLDFGHEYNYPDVKPPTLTLSSKELDDQATTDSGEEMRENGLSDNDKSSPGSDEGIGTDTETSKGCSSPRGAKSRTVTLELPLDLLFAMQLEEMFGPVKKRTGEDINPDDLKITLDLEAARMIYNLWKKSLSTDKWSEATLNFGAGSNSPVLLKDIMALELEMAKKREVIEKERIKNGEDLATRMKRQKLYNLFPGVDPTALDDIFDTNNFSLPQSLAALEEILGHGPNGSPLFSAEVAQQAEEELMDQALAESRQDLCYMEDDWLSWVAVEEFDDPELKKLQTNLFHNTGYNDLRMEAKTYHQLRMECFKKGQDAYNRGMKTVASFYSQQGHMHTQKLREANRRAASKILEIRNARNDPNILDLHGLHRDEAIVALNQFITDKKEELRNSQLNKIVLFIITGRGLHSANKTPKLKPVVEDFLGRGQYRFEAVHEGLFKVTLT